MKSIQEIWDGMNDQKRWHWVLRNQNHLRITIILEEDKTVMRIDSDDGMYSFFSFDKEIGDHEGIFSLFESCGYKNIAFV